MTFWKFVNLDVEFHAYLFTHFNAIFPPFKAWDHMFGELPSPTLMPLHRSMSAQSSCLSLGEVCCFHALWSETLLQLFNVFYTIKITSMLFILFEIIYIFISNTLKVLGTKWAFYVDNGFKCSWEFCQSQLDVYIETQLYLPVLKLFCTTLRFICSLFCVVNNPMSMQWHSRLRHCATSRKSRVRFLITSSEFFLRVSSSRTMTFVQLKL